MPYIQPKQLLGSFNCPHCSTVAQQIWWGVSWSKENYALEYCDIKVGQCTHCKKTTLWIGEKMYYPDSGMALPPNPEMPESVKRIYLEAASIQNKSPRGAAALLRLGVQVLCKELGEKGKDINEDIARLVKKGLPEIVQQSLDIVRVTGNDAVHPGQIDTDNPNTVNKLFELTNIIVEYMLALPNKVSGIYSALPKGKVDEIKKRDK